MQKSPVDSPPWILLALAFATVYITWGTTYLAIRHAVHHESLPPALFGGSRLTTAGLVVLGFLAARGQSLRLAPSDIARIAAPSVLLFMLANWLVAVAEQDIPSAVAAILSATTPLCTALLGSFCSKDERLGWRGWLGLVVGFIGVVCLMLPKLHGVHSPWITTLAPWLVLASAISWAAGSIILRAYPPKVNHLVSAGYQMTLGGLGQFVVGLSLGEWNRLPETITPGAAGAFVYLLVVGSLAGFLAFNWLLQHVSASKVGTYAYVNPVVAIAVAWLWSEEITFIMLIGVTVILAAVALVRIDRQPK